jgi:phosphoglycolate phosphatase
MPKNTNYDLIIFDWDGTIANSAGIIVESIKQVCAYKQISTPTDQKISSIIGLGLSEGFREIFPYMDAAEQEETEQLYREEYLKRVDDICLFDGVEIGIKSLASQGYYLAVATGKSRRGLNNALNKSKLNEFFKITKTMDECFSKPHPQMVNEILDTFMVEPSRALMIGDSSYDLEMAKNAMIDSVGVSYGAQPESQLKEHHPLVIVDNSYDLFVWLNKNG